MTQPAAPARRMLSTGELVALVTVIGMFLGTYIALEVTGNDANFRALLVVLGSTVGGGSLSAALLRQRIAGVAEKVDGVHEQTNGQLTARLAAQEDRIVQRLEASRIAGQAEAAARAALPVVEGVAALAEQPQLVSVAKTTVAAPVVQPAPVRGDVDEVTASTTALAPVTTVQADTTTADGDPDVSGWVHAGVVDTLADSVTPVAA